MKTIVKLSILTALLTCLAACDKTDQLHQIGINSNNAKLIGRTFEKDDVLWLSPSGSGVEFKINAKKCELIIEGDSMAGDNIHSPRYAVFLDGERVLDSVMKKKTETIEVFESDITEEHIVKLVKLSEALDSSMGLAGVKCDEGAAPEPTAARDLKIEFIGDSLTCGYGIDGKYGDSYSTSTEDCTKAFAIKAADMLDADYSIFAISGYGVISGFSLNNHKADDKVIADYYGKIGFSEGTIDSDISPADIEWDFSYKPDIVVINLGTNDDSYTQGDPEKEKEFEAGYIELLKQVRAKNPEAFILCTLGLMRQDLCVAAENAVSGYKELSGDSKVYYLTLEKQEGEAVIDEHPNETSHDRSAKQIVNFIDTIK